MKLSRTNAQNLQGTADLVSAEAMANEAIRIAEALMWAICGSDDAARAGAVAGMLRTKQLDRRAA